MVYKLPKPSYNADRALEMCIRRMNDKRKIHFSSIRADIIRAENQYTDCALRQQLHTFRYDTTGFVVTHEELVSLYDYLLEKRAGRDIYEHLFNLTYHTICPYCEYGIVDQVDHFLPKSVYSILSIIPINLVPACARCNRKKLNDSARSACSVFLHPYFEGTGSKTWLKATMEHSEPFCFKYSVVNPGHWSEEFFKRVKNQFRLLDFNTIYAGQASAWRDEEINLLHDLYCKGGEGALRDYLLELANDRSRINKKSTRFRVWQIPAFIALASDSWFCSGGVVDVFSS